MFSEEEEEEEEEEEGQRDWWRSSSLWEIEKTWFDFVCDTLHKAYFC